MIQTDSLYINEAVIKTCTRNYVKENALACLELDIPVTYPTEIINNRAIYCNKATKADGTKQTYSITPNW